MRKVSNLSLDSLDDKRSRINKVRLAIMGFNTLRIASLYMVIGGFAFISINLYIDIVSLTNYSDPVVLVIMLLVSMAGFAITLHGVYTKFISSCQMISRYSIVFYGFPEVIATSFKIGYTLSLIGVATLIILIGAFILFFGFVFLFIGMTAYSIFLHRMARVFSEKRYNYASILLFLSVVIALLHAPTTLFPNPFTSSLALTISSGLFLIIAWIIIYSGCSRSIDYLMKVIGEIEREVRDREFQSLNSRKSGFTL